MEKITKALLVFTLFVMAIVIGTEGGRDLPKTYDQVYQRSQTVWNYLGFGWPFGYAPFSRSVFNFPGYGGFAFGGFPLFGPGPGVGPVITNGGHGLSP